MNVTVPKDQCSEWFIQLFFSSSIEQSIWNLNRNIKRAVEWKKLFRRHILSATLGLKRRVWWGGNSVVADTRWQESSSSAAGWQCEGNATPQQNNPKLWAGMRSRLNYTRERKRKPKKKKFKKCTDQAGALSWREGFRKREREWQEWWGEKKRTKQCNFCPRGRRVSVSARGIVSHGGNNSRFVWCPHTNTAISPSYKCVTVAHKKKNAKVDCLHPNPRQADHPKDSLIPSEYGANKKNKHHHKLSIPNCQTFPSKSKLTCPSWHNWWNILYLPGH